MGHSTYRTLFSINYLIRDYKVCPALNCNLYILFRGSMGRAPGLNTVLKSELSFSQTGFQERLESTVYPTASPLFVKMEQDRMNSDL